MHLVNATTVRARKPHKCLLCHQPVEPGTMYRFTTMRGDDGLYSTHEHLACAALATMMCGQGPYRNDFPDRDDTDTYGSEDVWEMLINAQDEHVRTALAQLDEVEQARGRCFVAAAVRWGMGGVSADKAWARAVAEEDGRQREIKRGNRRTYVSFEGARHAWEMAVEDDKRPEAESAAFAPTSPTPE